MPTTSKTDTTRMRGGALCVLIGAAMAAPLQTLAQDSPPAAQRGVLDEIVVTAQRREESLRDIPIAVSAIGASELSNAGIDVTRELPQIVPAVQFTRSGPSGLFFIRGVGTTNAAAGEEGANAFYVDDVYLGDLAQTINHFNNIERVEVIKGPQGTLFGRNATGGLIHIITREPGDETVVNAELSYGNYQTVEGKLYAATPLNDMVSVDVALTARNQGEGWGRNFTLNRDVYEQDYWGIRSKMVIRPNDGLKFTLAGDYFDIEDNTGLSWKIDPETLGTGGQRGPRGHNTTADHFSLTKMEIWGVSFTAEADLGFADFTSISAFRKTDNDSEFDVDAGPLPIIVIDYLSGTETFQQEFRLASRDTEPFSWQAGVFYLRSEASNDSDFLGAAFAPNFQRQEVDAEMKTDSYALFGEGSYAFTPATRLTLGLRYTEDRRDFRGSQALIDMGGNEVRPWTTTTPSGQPLTAPGVQETKLTYDELTWRAALHHQLTDEVNLYASVNRGFKAGSFSLQNPLNDPFNPQTITAYEVGAKTEFFDRRLRVNLSAYYYDIDDYQVRSAAVANPGASLVLNAATVEVKGVDLDFEAAPTANLRVFGGLTYLDSRFDTFGGPGEPIQAPISYPNHQNTSCAPPEEGSRDPGSFSGQPTGGTFTCLGNVSGNDTPNAPEFSGNIGASYFFDLGEYGELRLSGLYYRVSEYFFESDNKTRQRGYGLLNASAEYRPIPSVGIALWGRNLTDEEYHPQKITTATGVNTHLGPPRTYGITLKYDY